MPESQPDPPLSRSARYGLVLFAVYVLLYGGFVLLNAFPPPLMRGEFLGGVNFAVLYGIGLILAAVALALLYVWLCRARPGDDGEAVR
jgi:uncharacterized membrane protein (DUF485 family)